MRIINNFAYPVLNLFGYAVPWEHPLFAQYLRKADPEVRKRVIENMDDQDLEVMDVWVSNGEMTAERRAAWPVFALDMQDFTDLPDDVLQDIDEATAAYWSLFFHNAIPEVVPWNVWETAYDYDEEGFVKWLKDLPERHSLSGILLRADERVASLYSFVFEGKDTFAHVHSLIGSFTVSNHVNSSGFLSNVMVPPDEIRAAAKEFGHTVIEESFNAEMKCIMKYIG